MQRCRQMQFTPRSHMSRHMHATLPTAQCCMGSGRGCSGHHRTAPTSLLGPITRTGSCSVLAWRSTIRCSVFPRRRCLSAESVTSRHASDCSIALANSSKRWLLSPGQVAVCRSRTHSCACGSTALLERQTELEGRRTVALAKPPEAKVHAQAEDDDDAEGEARQHSCNRRAGFWCRGTS
jgi:hypothetical protein